MILFETNTVRRNRRKLNCAVWEKEINAIGRIRAMRRVRAAPPHGEMETIGGMR